LNIGLAETKDIEAIEICAIAAYGKYVERIGREPAPMISDFETLVERGVVYVATNNAGQLTGFVVFYPRGDHMHLENIAVSPDYQGLGVGKMLIEFCEHEARARGLAAVELYTNEKMTENLMLYPKAGFVEIDRRSENGFSRVFFRKSL